MLDVEPTAADGPTSERAMTPPEGFDDSAVFRGAMRFADRSTDRWTVLP